MKIRSFSHVGLTVKSFDKAVKWYYDMFGFRLINEQVMEKEQVDALFPLYKLNDTALHLGFLRAPKGGVVEIFEFSKAVAWEHPCWNKPGLTHFTLDVKNVNHWYNQLKAKGVHFFSEPQNTNGTDWVFMQDPDGNLIELIDLKANYSIIRIFGGIAGFFMARTNFKKYYPEA